MKNLVLPRNQRVSRSVAPQQLASQALQSVSDLPPGDVFDTRGAAKYLNISPGLLVRYREIGGGPSYVKLSRLVRYRRTSLDAWLVSKERANSSAVNSAKETSHV